MRVQRRTTKNAAMLVPACATIGLLFGAALLGAALESLRVGALSGSLGVAAWRSVLADPAFTDALRFSAQTALVSTALSGVVAVALAAGLRRRAVALRGLLALPVPVPHLVVAVTAVLWLGSGGLVERALGFLPVTLIRDSAGLGVVAVYVYKEAPFLALLVLAAWGREVADREEVAAVLGANRWHRLQWVVWPAIRVPLGIGSLIVAAFAFGSFEVPLLVGPSYPPTLATFALEATRSADLSGQARAAASLLVAAGASILVALAVVRTGRGADG